METNLAYQEEFREELINGEIVAMSPAASNHNRIAGDIYGIFWNYLKGKKCEPFGDSEAVYLTETDHFIPDFMIVCDSDKIKSNGVHGAPDLVVEVLSPGTAKWRSMEHAASGNIGSCPPAKRRWSNISRTMAALF